MLIFMITDSKPVLTFRQFQVSLSQHNENGQQRYVTNSSGIGP